MNYIYLLSLDSILVCAFSAFRSIVPPIAPSELCQRKCSIGLPVVNCFPMAPSEEKGPPIFSPICPIEPSSLNSETNVKTIF